MGAKRIILKNKPLVEAIFELRWELEENENGGKHDPNYPLIIGSLYDKIKKKYPIHEQLPTSNIPHEMAEYIVQHQFKHEDGWPLIQLGPGILTFNDTEKYVWEDFITQISDNLNDFFNSYPNIEKFKVSRLELRYIDSVEFNYKENVFDFLRKKMKLDISLDDSLYKDVDLDNIPSGFDFILGHNTNKPNGIMLLRFGRGKVNDIDNIIWETIIRSNEDLPQELKDILNWLNEAHELLHDWFFKIIDGELLERFR